MSQNAAISRRHVLAGVAWTTPAIAIATAVPAAAASGAPGALALYQVSTALTATTMYARASVTYAGDGTPSPDLPVTAIAVQVAVLTSRVTPAVAPIVSGAGWTYTSRTTAGTNTVFTFTWTGADLSHTNTSTTELVAAIPKAASMNNLNVTYTANGTSNAAAVPPATLTLAALNAAVITFASGAANRIRYVASFTPVGGGAPFPAYRFTGTTRFANYLAGTSRPASEPITGTVVEVSIPAANTTGDRYDRTATSIGAGWSLMSGPTLVDGTWRLAYVYSTPLTATVRNSTTLDFMMRAITPSALNVASMTATGQTAGLTTSFTQVGPTA